MAIAHQRQVDVLGYTSRVHLARVASGRLNLLVQVAAVARMWLHIWPECTSDAKQEGLKTRGVQDKRSHR
jgi:hypothetical protein